MRLLSTFYNLWYTSCFFLHIHFLVSPNHDPHYRQVRARLAKLHFVRQCNKSHNFLCFSFGFWILFHFCVCKKFYRNAKSSISNSRNHPCSQFTYVHSPRHAKWSGGASGAEREREESENKIVARWNERANQREKSDEPKFIPLNTRNAQHFPCACTYLLGISISCVYFYLLPEWNRERRWVENTDNMEKWEWMRKIWYNCSDFDYERIFASNSHTQYTPESFIERVSECACQSNGRTHEHHRKASVLPRLPCSTMEWSRRR